MLWDENQPKVSSGAKEHPSELPPLDRGQEGGSKAS